MNLYSVVILIRLMIQDMPDNRLNNFLAVHNSILSKVFVLHFYILLVYMMQVFDYKTAQYILNNGSYFHLQMQVLL